MQRRLPANHPPRPQRSQRLEVPHQVALLAWGQVQVEASDVVSDDLLQRGGAPVVEVRATELRRMPQSAQRRGAILPGRAAQRMGRILTEFGRRVQPVGDDVGECAAQVTGCAPADGVEVDTSARGRAVAEEAIGPGAEPRG